MSPASERFRERLTGPSRLLGSFVKSASPAAVEILAAAGLDFVVIDQEHAPLTRADIADSLLAARAAGIAALVRVGQPLDGSILSALDSGACGVMVPHVSSLEAARHAATAARYLGGRRGYSGAVRAASYGGAVMSEYLVAADANVIVIAQIEDREALAQIDAIAQCPGIDALFIGLADLSVSFGELSQDAPIVQAAAADIAAAARRAGKPLWVFAASAIDAAKRAAQRPNAFIVSSDQGLLRRAASQAVKEFSELEIAP